MLGSKGCARPWCWVKQDVLYLKFAFKAGVSGEPGYMVNPFAQRPGDEASSFGGHDIPGQ